MKFCKVVFFISISAVSVIFVCLYAKQSLDKNKNRSDLELYYTRAWEEVYNKGYEVDQKGQLVWEQSQFETVVQKVEGEMLKEGFNREEIRQMKDEGRKKGQERRKFWDNYYAQKENENEKRAS